MSDNPQFGVYPDDVDVDEGYTLPRAVFKGGFLRTITEFLPFEHPQGEL